jgi:hypothetical protein
MHSLRRLSRVALAAGGALVALGAARAEPIAVGPEGLASAVVTVLDQLEPWPNSQVFHDGVLLSARSVVNFQNETHVEAYVDGRALAEVRLPHDVRSLHAYGPNAVLAIGLTSQPYWVSFYSVVTLDPATHALSATTRYFPMAYGPTYYVGDVARGTKYFADVGNGGLFVADSNRETAVTQLYRGRIPGTPDAGFPVNPVPWRTPRHPHEPGDVSDVPGVEVPLDSPNLLAPRLHGPGDAVMVGPYVFVVEHPSLGSPPSDLARVDTRDESISWPTPYLRDGILHLTNVPGTDYVIAAERNANKLLFVSAATNQLKHEAQLDGQAGGDTWDVTPFGHCVAVLQTLSRRVRFLDVRALPPTPVASWDVSEVVDRFHRARSLVADAASGTLYIRSDEPCPSSNCSTSFNDVRSVRETAGATLAACTP